MWKIRYILCLTRCGSNSDESLVHLPRLPCKRYRLSRQMQKSSEILAVEISASDASQPLSWLKCFKRTTSPHLSRKWAACWDRSFHKGLVPSLSCKLHSIFSNLWQFVLTAPTCSHVPSAPVNARTHAQAFTLTREREMVLQQNSFYGCTYTRRTLRYYFYTGLS